MGAWGPAIFSDDTACDVREEYRGLLGDGVPASQATDRLLEKWKDELSDPDVAPVFWLALAATQWKAGRLEERVKQEALGVMESGSDLARWQSDPQLESRRRKVLEKLRTQLNLPQPLPRKIPKPFRDSTDWQFGEAVGYRLASGRWVLFRVIGFHSDQGGTTPICELLDWNTERLPQPHEVRKLGILRRSLNGGYARWQ